MTHTEIHPGHAGLSEPLPSNLSHVPSNVGYIMPVEEIPTFPDVETVYWPFALEQEKPLNIRHWHYTDQAHVLHPPYRVDRTTPIILLVHGLGGCSEWLGDFAASLLESTPLVFGIELNEIGHHETRTGHFEKRQDIIDKLQQASALLSQTYQRPVCAVGISLGGLLVSQLAANHPPELESIVVISPAYKAATQTFKPGLYIQALGRYTLEKMGLMPGGTIDIPYANDHDAVTALAQAQDTMRCSPTRINKLSFPAAMELIKLTLFDSPKMPSKITCPVLMFVAPQDKICCPQTMVDIFNRMSSAQKKLYIAPHARHDITIDLSMPAMAKTIQAWISQRHAN